MGLLLHDRCAHQHQPGGLRLFEKAYAPEASGICPGCRGGSGQIPGPAGKPGRPSPVPGAGRRGLRPSVRGGNDQEQKPPHDAQGPFPDPGQPDPPALRRTGPGAGKQQGPLPGAGAGGPGPISGLPRRRAGPLRGQRCLPLHLLPGGSVPFPDGGHELRSSQHRQSHPGQHGSHRRPKRGALRRPDPPSRGPGH